MQHALLRAGEGLLHAACSEHALLFTVIKGKQEGLHYSCECPLENTYDTESSCDTSCINQCLKRAWCSARGCTVASRRVLLLLTPKQYTHLSLYY